MASAELVVHHPGIPKGHAGFYQGDIQELAAAGLIRFSRQSDNTWIFDITPSGFAAYAERQQAQQADGRLVEESQWRWLDTGGLAQRHPEAAAKVREAASLLVRQDVDNPSQLTLIGHLCREAQQAFATSLLRHYPQVDASENPANVVARVRAVLGTVAMDGNTVKDFADALLVYWGTLSDLVQRQEHGAQREGQALTWSDGRRVVFNTLFVMCELDRLLAAAS